MERKTFTYSLTPESLIEQRLPHKYPMEFTKRDMLTILRALADYSLNDHGSEHEDNAYSLRTGILETLDIEEI